MTFNPIQTGPPSLPGLHLQGHGHKKGIHGETLNDATGASGAAPAGSTQGLFGSLLDSVEQIIGVKSAAAAAATRSTPKL